jgi:two-component system osmolarity sensor histidine kinase EnvZ
MRRLWPDSLLARMLLVQGALLAAAALIFTVILTMDRNEMLSPLVAALGVPALRQVAASAVGSPEVTVIGLSGGLRREAGPPSSFKVRPFLRPFQAYKAEFARHGIQVDDAQLTDLGTKATVWIAVRVDGGLPAWIRVRGYPLLPTWGPKVLIGLLLLTVLIGLASRYFVRRVTQPLDQMLERMRSHAQTGSAQPPATFDARWPPPPELQAMAEAYRQLAERLARNERERALLLAGVSHDLRSPLARIRLAAELLPETSENTECVAAITRNVDQVDRLIGSFLEFVRTSTQTLGETVDAAAVVREAVAGIGRPSSELVAYTPERLLLHGASSLLLERLVVNLAENALKHGGSPVQVHVAAVEDVMELTVVDTGPGLPVGGAERLMEAFARGDTSRGVPGFGLGLAIVQQIVVRLQGRLLFERSPVGHRVQVVLPLRR